MQFSCAILNVSIIIFELYWVASTEFVFVQLFFDAGEIVLPNSPFCIFMFSMYTNFLWRLRRFTSNSTRASIIYTTCILTAGHLLFKPMWILLISCSAKLIRWIGNAFNQNYTIESGSKQQILISYVSLALAVIISSIVFSKKTVSDLAPKGNVESVRINRRNKIIKYRVPK